MENFYFAFDGFQHREKLRYVLYFYMTYLVIKLKKLLLPGTKPHICPVCQYKAGTSSNLKRHMGIHKDIREHKCDICGLCFRQKIHLERHVKYKHEVRMSLALSDVYVNPILDFCVAKRIIMFK